ncbi:MAG TPA: DMT family transporter [Candidatus Saccharimonadales bacterium]|nr:DMT family transporter [Candidatus Saccharimonadales bacterium]
MTTRTSRIDWLIFLSLGFIWGSSYLFIKLAVDDFGTFTLVALRLIVGSAFLWIVLRIAGQALPRDRRLYGHLLVMAIINITIPFLLITWAEQSVESSLAAILTSPVPLFAIVLSALFLPDEPMRVNGLVGLIVGFVGVVIITSRGLTGEGSSVIGEIALLGAAISYAAGAVYSRRNVRGVPPMIPAVFQVSFAALITGAFALVLEHPWDARPDTQAVFSILWLGILGSGVAYLFVFRLFAAWGATRTTLVAYLLPVVGIALGYIFLQEPIDGRLIVGTVLVIAGIALVNSRFGRRRVFGRTPRPEAA